MVGHKEVTNFKNIFIKYYFDGDACERVNSIIAEPPMIQ